MHMLSLSECQKGLGACVYFGARHENFRTPTQKIQKRRNNPQLIRQRRRRERQITYLGVADGRAVGRDLIMQRI
jgi:hypothetical protein